LKVNTQPALLDINGDQILDVLYQPVDGPLRVALGTADADTYEFESFFDSFVMGESTKCATPSTSDQLS
jgi:hypothetical protein